MWLTHFWHSWSQFFIFAWEVTAGGILRTGVLICLVLSVFIVWKWSITTCCHFRQLYILTCHASGFGFDIIFVNDVYIFYFFLFSADFYADAILFLCFALIASGTKWELPMFRGNMLDCRPTGHVLVPHVVCRPVSAAVESILLTHWPLGDAVVILN